VCKDRQTLTTMVRGSMQQPFPPMILYGADYNPEQWPEAVWLDDMRLMKLANVNMVSINIFSWALLEPAPDRYQFDRLDRIMDMLGENDIAADLATATASPPTWMSRLYPDILPVTRDGKRLSHGSRQHYCPNSPSFRRKSAELVRRLAERYHAHPALIMWHVNNEYGAHTPSCYCDTCAAAFRTWLLARYRSLDALNIAWGTDFWSQRYYDWEDVLPPRITPAQNNPGQFLDYQRFMSDSLLACYPLKQLSCVSSPLRSLSRPISWLLSSLLTTLPGHRTWISSPLIAILQLLPLPGKPLSRTT